MSNNFLCGYILISNICSIELVHRTVLTYVNIYCSMYSMQYIELQIVYDSQSRKSDGSVKEIMGITITGNVYQFRLCN